MVHRVVVAFACVVGSVGVAMATHPGGRSDYAVLGFTADSKYVYFQKDVDDVMVSSVWLAVYDATTGKLKTSQPVERACAIEDDCDASTISKKVGAKTIAKLHASHGAPSPGSRLVASRRADQDDAIRDARQAGHLQTFTGKDLEVRTRTKLRGRLVDPMETGSASASFELDVTVTAGGSTWTAKRRLNAESVNDTDNANIELWPELYVQELAVAPDRRAVALVFARRPFVVKLAAVAPASPSFRRP